jgi:hypothetical protein
MKCSRDVIGHLEDIFLWVGDPEIPQPDKISQEGCPVVDGWILILINAGIRNVTIDIAVV